MCAAIWSGYDGLDLCVDAGDLDTLDGEYLERLVELTHCPISVITAPERHVTSALLERIFIVATRLQVSSVNVYPPHRLDKKTEWFPLLLQQQKDALYSVNVVNVEPKTILWVLPEYKDARPDALSRYTGTTAIDLSNIDESSGVSLIKTLTLMGASIHHVTLCDRGETKARLPFGKGSLPIESFLSKLKSGGYARTITLSVDAKYLTLEDPTTLEKELREMREGAI
jgi:hypothetical protein